MKLPATIRIGPYRCKTSRFKLEGEMGEQFGGFDPNTYELTLAEPSEFIDEAMEASTLIHELVHALITIYRIKVPDDEALVEILETALVQVLKDNKTLIRSILRVLK